MKKITLTLLLFSSISVFAQKEASNWFFGFFAGIHFNEDGTVVPLPGGQMATNEGCSVISDSDGNLLFYTDGRNVWDRNHLKMPNGNYNAGKGLMGDPSSSQSGIIVPKKGDPNVYYIFTVDEPHHENAAVYPNVFSGPYADTGQGIPDADDGFNNGLNYSVVDLSVTGSNGSIGDVVTRNVHLVTYNPANIDEAKYRCSEKITAVKNNTGTGFWVVTHFIDKFYAFAVNETGVNTTPVVSQITPVVSQAGYRRNSIGYIKASPNGRKLAIAHQQRGNIAGGTQQNGAVYLYNFNNSNGVVSNAIMLSQNTIPYGIEFSPQSKKLYVSYDFNNAGYGGIHQYNLQSADVPASDVFIANATSAALQLGPNGMIYHAVNGGNSLSVIHLPDEDGLACDYEPQGVLLSGGMTTVFGLPPFITSLFSANIQAEHTCLGDTTQFSVAAIGDFQTIDWDFGDGTAHSSELAPAHVYAAPGQYSVVAVITNDGDVYTVTTELTIYAIPVANTAPAINECDPENNGTEIFDLTARTAAILGGQAATNIEVRYFDSQANADANTNNINAATFTNTSNPQTIYARVHQRGNNKCFATTFFEIRAVQAPVSGTLVAICDDATDGSDTNGRATFNLADAASNLVQNNTDYTITWYVSEANAASVLSPLPVSFYNTTPNEQIVYMRVQNNTYTNCATVFPIMLKVNPLIPPMPGTTLVQCPNPNGANIFNLTQADTALTNGDTALAVTYYRTQADAENNIDPITGAFANTSNPQVIAARVAYTTTGCYRIVPVTLEVTTTVLPAVPLEECDNDGTEDGFTAFDLTILGLESQTNNVTYYTSLNHALMELNPVPSAFTNTVENTQRIFARVENNNECAALQGIQLIVRPLPDIDIGDEAIVCLNTRDDVAIDGGVLSNHTNYHFLWSTGETTHTIFVNTPGTYTVEVTNISNISQCSKIRTIVVEASDVAVFDDIIVEDLRQNNTITVMVHPGNNVATTYLYSLDQPNGPWQESNYFENVSAGIHTVYVYDTQGCGISKRDVPVLGIPNFFTPNGDGVNDTWNITGINALFYYNSKIYIFDRYGKLLADVDPRGLGWDGTHNGRLLPSTDYWYVLQLANGRTVKGHFSMVR